MRLITTYIFISLFLAGIFQPTIYVFSELSDTSPVAFENNIPETKEESENEKSKGSSEFADDLDDFFNNQSLLHFAFPKTNRHVLSETTLVSDFSDILIRPPKV